MSIAVGIDLGTTNTVVAAVRDGLAFTIADPNGRRLIPSTVSFHPSGNVLVGEPAVDRRLIDPENTIYSVKRLIGRSWTSEEVQKARARFPFKMKEGPKYGTIVVARGEEYTLPEISAFVLRYAKATAEAALGVPVDRAVITVPANFNDLQRAATKVAGKLAGLDVLRILNEPTAAALAYGQGAGQEGRVVMNEAMPRADPKAKGERVAVYDLGGGTFDVTLLDLSGNVFEVLATAGDTSLGGDDFDGLIAEKMADELLKKHRFDARTDPQAFGRLRLAAEALKRDLSSKEEAQAQLAEIAYGPEGKALPFSFKMTRTELEWASLSLVDRTFAVCQTAIERAGLGVAQIDRVILVGGSTRMPLVARRVEQFFRKPPVMRVNPDEVVALGAAIQANALDRTGRRRTLPGAVPAPTIAEASILAPAPQRAPAAAASAPSDDELMVPGLPVVMGHTSSGAMRAASKAPPAAPSVVPPMRPRARTLPMEFERNDAPAPPPPAPADPILPIGVGDLDAELPAPEPPPAPSPAAARNQGRPLVFDLAEPPPPRAAPPAPPPPAAAPPAAQRGFGELSALGALPSAGPVDVPPAPSVAPKPPLLIDVTPLSLNVETVGGFCDTLIEANTPVPCDRTRVFLTASDNQTAVVVRVAQGDSKKFAENTFLGELELSGLAPARRGEVHVAVTFEIDADGILNVKARDQKTGKETRARMQLVGAQTEEHELEAMRARQARHAVG